MLADTLETKLNSETDVNSLTFHPDEDEGGKSTTEANNNSSMESSTRGNMPNSNSCENQETIVAPVRIRRKSLSINSPDMVSAGEFFSLSTISSCCLHLYTRSWIFVSFRD